MRPRRLSPRRKVVYLFLLLLLPLTLLFLIELLTRLFLAPVPSIRLFVRGVYPDLVTQAEGQPVFIGDPLLAWRLCPNLHDARWDFTVFSTNDQGLRYPRHVGRKPAGALRVLCVGDSVTFGYRVPVFPPGSPDYYDRNAKPYPARLEALLRARHPDRSIEVIPLAVPGYSSRQGLAWLRRDIDQYAPDLVTLCFGWNDCDLRARPDSVTLPLDVPHQAARRLVASSRTLSHLVDWVDRRMEPTTASLAASAPARLVPRVSRERFVGNMLAMAQLAREHGARVVAIGTVYRDAVTAPAEAARIHAWRRALAEACVEKDVRYLEVPELTEAGAPANATLFGEVIHPNDAGHALLAERLDAFIAARGLLPIAP